MCHCGVVMVVVDDQQEHDAALLPCEINGVFR